MRKKEKIQLTAEQERIAKDIFWTVFKWGEVPIRVDESAPTYREFIAKLLKTTEKKK